MLTSDLIQVRAYKGEMRPRYVEARDPERLALAKRLIETFEQCEGEARHVLDEELKALLGTGTAFQLHRALAKLLRDRCTFDTEAPAPPEELREAVFAASADAYRVEAGEAPFRFDRSSALEVAAKGLSLTPDAVEQSLYADLKDEQVLQQFDRCEPKWLLDRYNVALAQGVLYKAIALEIHISGQSTTAYRTLFRKIKFFQLMHRVERRGDAEGGGYRIRLDGPLSVLRASGRYGLQMAVFLPTLLHFNGWTLDAELRWGKGRRKRTFRLTPTQGLRPYTRKLGGQWQPDELQWLPDQLAALDRGWTASTDAELIDLGGEGVLVPDYVFEHAATGRRVFMEVFGYWNKGAVKARLRLLRKHGPKNLVLALSKGLAAGAGELDDVPAEVYVFRTTPLARQVVKVLEAMPT